MCGSNKASTLTHMSSQHQWPQANPSLVYSKQKPILARTNNPTPPGYTPGQRLRRLSGAALLFGDSVRSYLSRARLLHAEPPDKISVEDGGACRQCRGDLFACCGKRTVVSLGRGSYDDEFAGQCDRADRRHTAPASRRLSVGSSMSHVHLSHATRRQSSPGRSSLDFYPWRIKLATARRERSSVGRSRNGVSCRELHRACTSKLQRRWKKVVLRRVSSK